MLKSAVAMMLQFYRSIMIHYVIMNCADIIASADITNHNGITILSRHHDS